MQAIDEHDDFGSETVEIRAHRGERRASIYREHLLPAAVLAHAISEASQHHLPLLASLEPWGSRELTREEATALLAELNTLRSALHADRLGQHLDAIAAVVRFCSDSREPSWLSLAGP